MSHSGNQGPGWWFRIFGQTGGSSGIARAVVLSMVVLIVVGAGVALL